MKRSLTLAAAILAATTAFAGTVTGTNTVTNSQASAKLKIRKAITLTNTTDLDFGGVVVAGSALSSITLTPANVLSTTGGAEVLATFGTTTAGVFTVGGTANATFAINAITGVDINSLATPLTPVAVTFTPSAATGTLSAGGSATFNVGGTATIPSGVTAGDYIGTFSVTVQYN